MKRSIAVLVAAGCLACQVSVGPPGPAGGGSATGGGTGGAGGAGGSGSCLESRLLSSLGRPPKLMVGMMVDDDAVATRAPWDVRYTYLAGGIFDGAAPCASCASGCTAAGASCSNSAGCGWWGCWQSDQEAPGAFVRDFASTAKAAGQLPMITYYEELQASGAAEGSGQVAKLSDAAFMTRYFADWRFTLQQLGPEKALLHLEPDLWGYAMQANRNPKLIPAAVATANAADCGALENTFAGFARCLVAMARKYAPNAKVGFHASAWMTSIDVSSNTDPGLDVVREANGAADFLIACGSDATDFIAVETSDRDAGWYRSQGDPSGFWDVTNATLPDFHQMFTWAKAVSERAGKPLVWWQLPVGNLALDDTPLHWKDNRVEYFFGHTAEVAATHAVLMAFGAGAADQTTPATDNGNLIDVTKAYVAAGGQATCP